MYITTDFVNLAARAAEQNAPAGESFLTKFVRHTEFYGRMVMACFHEQGDAFAWRDVRIAAKSICERLEQSR